MFGPRTNVLQDYFFFANPTLPPGHFSLVMQNGTENGFACYIDGNNNAFIAPDQIAGYADCKQDY